MKRPYTKPKIRTYPLKRTPGGCLEWLGCLTWNGYPSVWVGGKSRRAHRALMGEPPGMVVCHSCDNRSCCNPGHLFIGTQKDNMQDALNKGRIRRWTPEVRRQYDRDRYWNNIEKARRKAREAMRRHRAKKRKEVSHFVREA